MFRQDLQQRGFIPNGAGMSISDFDGILDMIAGGGQPSYTGKLVSPRNSLGIDAVWACVNGLAGDYATLPMVPYRWGELVTKDEPDGTKSVISGPGVTKYEARDHYLWPLMTEQANPRMSAWRFKFVMETWRQLWGNAYGLIDMNGRGQVTAIWPIRADRVKVWVEDPNDIRSRIWYAFVPSDRNIAPVIIDEDHMLHIRGISLDGVTGLSPIEVHRQSLGLPLAMTEFAGRFYSNGATMGGALTHPGKLGEKAMKSLRESLDDKHRGLSQAHKLLILEEGMTYNKIAMPQEDAQFIETWGLNNESIARIFGFPGYRIGLKDPTNNNIEQLAKEYILYRLGPNAANWAGEIHCSLLSARERDSVFVAPDYSYQLVPDAAARATLYQMLGNQGALSADDMRHSEGKNPLPGGIGRTPRVQSNTIELGTKSPAQVSQEAGPTAGKPGAAPMPDEKTKPNGHAAGVQ